MKTKRRDSLLALSLAGSLFNGAATPSAWAIPSPESETLAIARTLRPIGNDRWMEIAGERVSEQYVVAANDTLYDISQRLFGDPNYWPKIWALNNETGITNPHYIRPGKQIAFLPGTGTSLPGVELADASSGSATHAGVTSGVTGRASSGTRSDAGLYPTRVDLPRGEWQKLPPQPWESVQLHLPPEVDPDGFDRRSKIKRKVIKGFELNAVASTETIDWVGVITGARNISLGLGLTNTIFISSERDLQKGEIYAVTHPQPTRMKSRRKEDEDKNITVGLLYPILGKVEIVGRIEGLYVAKVMAGRGVQTRGNVLIPLPARVDTMDPVPATSSLDATLYVDRTNSTGDVAQYHQVYFDRGSEDGVAPGMIFRAFLQNDPFTGRQITQSRSLRNADIQVLQVSESFSSGVVLNTVIPLQDQINVTLLTDVSDVLSSRDFREVAPDTSELDGDGTPPSTAPIPELEDDLGAGEEPAPAETPPPLDESLGGDDLGNELEGGELEGGNAATPPVLDDGATPPAATEGPDELDALDDGKELQDGEKKELQQLEGWEGNPPEGGAPEAPATAPIDDLDADLSLDAPAAPAVTAPEAPAAQQGPADEVPAELPSSLDEGSMDSLGESLEGDPTGGDPNLQPIEAEPAPEAPAQKKPAPKKSPAPDEELGDLLE